MNEIIKLLHEGDYSCVIKNGDKIRTFSKRGVNDLYDLLQSNHTFLKGASIVDKIVGKAAAALMILGGISELYTDYITTSALRMLIENGIKISFRFEIPVILNRFQTDWCPLEIACYDEDSPEKIFNIIEKF